MPQSYICVFGEAVFETGSPYRVFGAACRDVEGCFCRQSIRGDLVALFRMVFRRFSIPIHFDVATE